MRKNNKTAHIKLFALNQPLPFTKDLAVITNHFQKKKKQINKKGTNQTYQLEDEECLKIQLEKYK